MKYKKQTLNFIVKSFFSRAVESLALSNKAKLNFILFALNLSLLEARRLY